MRISSVRENTLGAKIGLKPGDTILSVNERKPKDIIELSFVAAEPRISLAVLDGHSGTIREVKVDKEPDESLGVEFETAVFDGIIRCRNRCVFCFVDQMPRGFRSSLYVKDDDYRLSFLQGNFITLNRLTAADLKRIIDYSLSPLYVSVHSTEPGLRCEIMGSKNAARFKPILRSLAKAGIEVHAQFVLCPDINDGERLERSLEDLWAFGQAVRSVGIVPVGLTKFREGLPRLEPYDSQGAAEVLERVSRWQRRALAERGDRWVYCADEFHTLVGSTVPDDAYYGDYPQLENGIGLVRTFLNEWKEALRSLEGTDAGIPPDRVPSESGGRSMERGGFLREYEVAITRLGSGEGEIAMPARAEWSPTGAESRGLPVIGVVTGEAFAPFLRECIAQLEELNACGRRRWFAAGFSGEPCVQVISVPNETFGGNIRVTGLLTGEDILKEVKRRRPGPGNPTILLVPEVTLRDGKFLDDRTLEWLERKTRLEVKPVRGPMELLQSLRLHASDPPKSSRSG